MSCCPNVPQHPLGRGSSPIPPGNLQLHKTSTKTPRGGTGAAVISRANEHESVPHSHRETNSCEFRQTNTAKHKATLVTGASKEK